MDNDNLTGGITYSMDSSTNPQWLQLGKDPSTWDALGNSLVYVTIVGDNNNDQSVVHYPPDIVAKANAHWKDIISVKPNLFDGPIWCVVNHKEEKTTNGRLVHHLWLQRSSYRFVLLSCKIATTSEYNNKDFCCSALGVSAICITSDGMIILGKRSAHCGTSPNKWHLVPAGTVDRPNIFAVLVDELHEELNVRPINAKIRVVGMLNTGAELNYKPEMVYAIQIQEKHTEIRVQNDEHQKLAFYPVHDEKDNNWRKKTTINCKHNKVVHQSLRKAVKELDLVEVARNALVLFMSQGTQ